MSGTAYYFENEYKEYSPELSINLLNSSHTEVSDRFKKKITKYYDEKIKLLTSCMQDDIYYDGTIYTGSSGLAYHYLICTSKKQTVDIDMLKTALQYIQLDGLKGKRFTFLCGDAGPLALATVISKKLDSKGPANLPDYKIFCKRLLALMSTAGDGPDELLYGKSGYLFALLFVNQHVGKEVIPRSHIEKVVNSILKSGKKYSTKVKSDCPLLWRWHDKVYLGAAHGVAGILYMLLQAKSYVSTEDMNNYVRPTLDWLMTQQYLSKNFPSSLGSPSDRLVQWCHGAPGFVPLCILASQVFEDEQYMKIALECGDVIWQRGLTSKGYSLCHGVSGNAYAFIQLYQVSKKPVHLYRAACFMDWVITEQPLSEQHQPDRPASMFEGLLGRIHLAHDFLDLAEAKFPAMTV